MLEQKQLFLHNPPESYGDCHRTVIACLLDLPVDVVPNFAEKYWDNTGEWNRKVDEWLMDHHMVRQFHTVYQDPGKLEDLLSGIDAINPGSVFLLCGTSKNGTAHSVIAGSGKILWDPSRDNSGIVAPVEGYYWITILVPYFHFPTK